MKSFWPILVVVLAWLPAAQAVPFRNFDFESANLPVIPQGEYGSPVPVSDALPGWNVFVGTTPLMSVYHNNITLGPAMASVFGPDWPYGLGGRIDGNYTLMLVGGGAPPDLSMSQTGLVPPDSHWLLFKGKVYQFQTPKVFAVSLNGQEVPMTALATYPGYSLYGGDISTFAGSEAELQFTVYPGPSSALGLDSIEFSAVPEPAPVALLGFGLAAVGLWHWHRRLSRRAKA